MAKKRKKLTPEQRASLRTAFSEIQDELRGIVALLQRRLDEHQQRVDEGRVRVERRRRRLRRLTFGLFPR
jgi:ribosomal protein S4